MQCLFFLSSKRSYNLLADAFLGKTACQARTQRIGHQQMLLRAYWRQLVQAGEVGN